MTDGIPMTTGWRWDRSEGEAVLREHHEVRLWAYRSGETTTLSISETGKPPRCFSIPNAVADALAARLRSEDHAHG